MPSPETMAVVLSRGGITLTGKAKAMWCEKSDETIVPIIAKTIQLCLGKGLYFDHALNRGKC